MPQNFLACDRGQTMLLPPDLTDWVPDDHVVWSILGAVDQMDLSAFYGAYRENGQGRAAYEPSMMVALLLHAYARGNRSSRGIERACREDVTYKLITAMRVPDHSTIAEFRRRHERALGELFTKVLALCDEAGLVEVGVISIDGVKIRANASRGANRSYGKLVADILKEAEETDRWEDGLFGADRGDEPPEHLRTEEGRRAAFKAAKERLAAKAGRGEEPEVAQFELDPEFSTTGQGRRAWHREGRKALLRQRFMRRVLASEHGHALYKHRKATVEPVFAQIKFNRKINRIQRRGRAAALSEWRLVAATHNLMKLHNQRIAVETG